MQVLKYLIVICSLIVFNSCNTSPEIHPADINGYWEIEKVIQPNGEEQVYKINETIDYIELTDKLVGYRQKILASQDGVNKPTAKKERIRLAIEQDSINLYYETAFSSWKETILELNTKHLKIVNPNNIIYIYKRYIPLNL